MVTLGAVPADGGVRFRVPATAARQADLVLHTGAAAGRHQLRPHPDGLFDLFVPGAAAGDRYSYSLDGGPLRPDPVSRFQPQGVHESSEVVDADAFPWTDAQWRGCAPRDLVVYELHVGTFSPQGTFTGARERLSHLRDLGVTAIELMPVADFSGSRNWGYDGVCPFAPSRAYGRPEHLRAFVDAAHQLGLAVMLDVVYNHLGPEGAYLPAFVPEYLTDRHHTPWGRAVNLDGAGSSAVRQLIVANAAHWIREYHLDGLRLDATHALIDDSPTHIVADIAAAARAAASWRVHVHAEDHRNLSSMIDESPAGMHLDGVWADDFHHAVRRRIAGDADGYYRRYRGAADEIACTLREGWLVTKTRGTDPTRVPMQRFIVCLQNHDQIGNRARGDRLHHGVDAAMWRAASVLLLMSPMTPLLFMGQEWAAGTPFQFFTDMEPALGADITRGRRLEFAAFPEFSDPMARESIPDPQAQSTFDASRLQWDERQEPEHQESWNLYRALIALRHSDVALGAAEACTADANALDDDSIVMRRGAFTIVVRLSSAGSVHLPLSPSAAIVLTSEEARFASDPQPPSITWGPPGADIHFGRAGAIILRTDERRS